MIKTINPATGEVLNSYPKMMKEEVDRILSSANNAFEDWKEVTYKERAEKMIRTAALLRERKKDYAALMTAEMGKPILQSAGEIEKCAWVCEYFAENAEAFLKDEIIQTDASKSYVTFRPMGVVLAIMPWNFPFWQVFRYAAPNLMAGNGGILKHSDNVTGIALAIENLFKDAGFPENLFRTIVVPVKDVEGIIYNDNISAVTLTGSVRAGKNVAAEAGKVLKKTVLELGGSDPYVILEDADLEKTVETCITSRLLNSGQSCIAAKRFIVVDKIYKKFEEMFVEGMRKKIMGDPLDEKTDIGPQARLDLREGLNAQVNGSISKGAKLLLGGVIPETKGAFYPVTVLSNVTPGMPVYEEEVFGPAAALIRVKDEDDAVKIANDSSYGLGAAVFTADTGKGEKIAREKLNAGSCFINDFVKSDPRLPFGGIKESGYGRELSVFGMKEFVNIKTVYIK